MSGGSSPATTQQTTKVELPAWVEQASQENYQFAKDVANRPLSQYEGQTVAGPSGMTTDAYGRITNLANQPSGVNTIAPISSTGVLDATNPYFKEAGDLYRSSAGPLDIQKFMNPYLNEVEQRAIGNANTALDKRLLNVTDAAQKASSFGGSRSAVERGVTSAEGVKGIGDLSAELRKSGFDTASSLASADLARKAGAGAGMLATGGAFQGAQTEQQQALIRQQQAQMAKRGQDQDISMQNINALLGGGQQQEGYQQRLLDAAKAKFYEARDYGVEQLNLRLAALGMSPYGKTETGTKIATSEDKGPDWATIGLGALKTLPSLVAMSDRRTKTDIMKLGKDTDSGLDMYAYRYKGDPKSYPKVVGPMAQDIEKKYPKAVKKVSGYKTIDLSNLMEVLS